MLVGAGLMFVLMHGEVSAKGKPKKLEPFVCSEFIGGGFTTFTSSNLEL